MTDDGHFGEAVAATYDDPGEVANSPEATEPVVAKLVELARGERVLEFAIGTGRIALPLAARGVEVHGIELSNAMVRQLRAKPSGDQIPVAIGDMSTTRVEGTFGLVYLVFNTIMNIVSQDGQAACFANAAAHLSPGGVFVIEVLVPALQRLAPGERFVVYDASDMHWGVDEYDILDQGVVSNHFNKVGDYWELSRVPFRYVWPSELDLMAAAAGMKLVHRWSDWIGTAFTADSPSHVSVWQKT